MQLSLISTDDGVIQIQCEGNISQQNIQPGHDPLEILLGSDCYDRTVLLNLEKTEYIDSSGVSWLMGRHKKFLNSGGRLILHSVPPMVTQVLQLLRMTLILHLAADERAARALALGGQS
ncbi:MAG TPA: STAS domain-containing protein [Gemmataceae bacterium]|nr:STAS domain-containing protein [Gemmataceae bacterium]